MAGNHVSDTFNPTKPREREYTPYQQKLLDTVVEEFNGDVVRAAKATGHSNPKNLIDSLKDELIEIANGILARSSIKASLKLGEVLDSDTPITQVEAKLKAAQMILERTNPKTDKVDVSGEVKTGLIILPAKRAESYD
jgi:hypothetical protein